MRRAFRQVDVFTMTPYLGNPLAVVLEADGLAEEEMQRFAAWTALSETTFVLPPSTPGADYRVRIFTPSAELPFAGHPTLGTCHAWLEAGGRPAREGVVLQECGAGLIAVRRTTDGLAFSEPPLLRSGPVEESVVSHAVEMLGLARDDVIRAQWADNGPGWVALLLRSVEVVLAVRPGAVDLDIGIAALFPPGSAEALEVRAFFPKDGMTVEDPVTGSLNASLAGWLIRSGRIAAPYVARQGTVLGRAGRVHVTQSGDGTIWIGGGTATCVVGEVDV